MTGGGGWVGEWRGLARGMEGWLREGWWQEGRGGVGGGGWGRG